jgi:hypothetical protein
MDSIQQIGNPKEGLTSGWMDEISGSMDKRKRLKLVDFPIIWKSKPRKGFWL